METNKKCYNLEDLIQSLGGKTDLTKAIENVLRDEKKSGIKQDEEKLTNDEIKGAMDFVSSLIFGNEPKREVKNTNDKSNSSSGIKNSNKRLRLPILTKEDIQAYMDMKKKKLKETESPMNSSSMMTQDKDSIKLHLNKKDLNEAMQIKNERKNKIHPIQPLGLKTNFSLKGGVSGAGKPISLTIKEQFKRGDKVRIIQGDYKGLDSKKCVFLDYVKSMNAVLLQLDDYNRLYVKEEDIELIRPKTIQYDKYIHDRVSDKTIKVQVFQDNSNKFVNVCLSNNKNYFIQEKFINEKNISNCIEKAYYKLMNDFYERELRKQC